MPEPLWQSWSHYGRIIASQILKIPVEGILPTTNHLESFNGLLKRKYLPQWQRCGTRLRVDFLILILITKILPEIFALRRTLRDYKQWLHIRFSNGFDGSSLPVERHRDKSRSKEPPLSTEGNLCWWPSDANRDAEALALVRLNRIYDFRQKFNLHQYEATCVASRGSLEDPNHPRYYIYIHRDGFAACTCPDFSSRGAACKHLRAFRIILENWVEHRMITPFYFPLTAEAARNIRSFVQRGPSGAPSSSSPTTAAVLHNFLALQRIAGPDTTATDEDGEENDKNPVESEDVEQELISPVVRHELTEITPKLLMFEFSDLGKFGFRRCYHSNPTTRRPQCSIITAATSWSVCFIEERYIDPNATINRFP